VYGQGGAGPRWLPTAQTVVLGADGRTYRRVDLARDRGGPAEFGSWEDAPVLLSPDGTRLAVGSRRAVDTVAVVDLRTGRAREHRLDAPGRLDVLAWSPDGALLALAVRPADGRPGGYWRLDLVSGGVEPLAAAWPVVPAFDAESAGPTAAFAPDGRRVAIQPDPDSQDPDRQSVWVVDVGGRTAEVAAARRLPVRFGGRLVGDVAWSPDGRWLAVEHNAEVGKVAGTVELLDPAGGSAAAPAVPAIPRATVSVLGWRSPGMLLLTEAGPTDRPTVYEADLRGGAAREVVRTPPGRWGTTSTYRMRAAAGLVPDVAFRPAAEPDRGPWPWWWRLAVAVAALLAAGLPALVVLVARRRRATRAAAAGRAGRADQAAPGRRFR
jgi:Tol biopolymer transport system component